MLIAVTTTGQDLEAHIDSRFGRAPFILLFDTDQSSFRSYDNKINLNAAQGAGIQTAQNIVELNATVAITGNCGPKAFKVLSAGKVKIFSSPAVPAKEAIRLYQENQLTELTNPNVESHW